MFIHSLLLEGLAKLSHTKQHLQPADASAQMFGTALL